MSKPRGENISRRKIALILFAILLPFGAIFPIVRLEKAYDWDLGWLQMLLVWISFVIIVLIRIYLTDGEYNPLKAHRDRYILISGIVLWLLVGIYPWWSKMQNPVWYFLFPALGCLFMAMLIKFFGTNQLKIWAFSKSKE